MRPVLCKEQRAGDDQEADQHPPGTRSYRVTFSRIFLMVSMILHCHETFLFGSVVKLDRFPKGLLMQIKNSLWSRLV
jgi:hypothetical protein